MDAVMPICDGIGAVREIRALEAAMPPGAHAAPVPVLAMTAATDPALRKALCYAGMTRVLVRPLSRAGLVAALAAELDAAGPRQAAAGSGRATAPITSVAPPMGLAG